MKQFFLLIILSISFSFTFAQQVSIEGRVMDENNAPLAFANIRVEGTTSGASANNKGKYALKLNGGTYIMIASYIGYISDTVKVNASGKKVEQNFILKQTNIILPEITVLPGENPADEIIRKAIKRKKRKIFFN